MSKKRNKIIIKEKNEQKLKKLNKLMINQIKKPKKIILYPKNFISEF